MYPTGWKHTGEQLSTTAAVTEFSTSLQAPTGLIIPCEEARMCLITTAADVSGAGNFWLFWGTNADGQGAQKEGSYCSHELGLFAQSNAYSLNPTSEQFSAMGLHNMTEFSEISAFTQQDSGANSASGEAISAAHYWNRLTGNQTIPGHMGHESGGSEEPARSAASSDANDLWIYWGDGGVSGQEDISDAGAGIVALTCSAFKYIQVQFIKVSGSKKCTLFYNLLV